MINTSSYWCISLFSFLKPDKPNFYFFRYRVNAWFLYWWLWIHTREVCWYKILPCSSILITFIPSVSFIWIDKWPIMKTNLVYRGEDIIWKRPINDTNNYLQICFLPSYLDHTGILIFWESPNIHRLVIWRENKIMWKMIFVCLKITHIDSYRLQR